MWQIIYPHIPIILERPRQSSVADRGAMRDGGTAPDDDLAATVEALEAGKDTILWNNELTGFGGRIHPAGTKSFIVNYRAGDGGRKAPNKRVVICRYGRVTLD